MVTKFLSIMKAIKRVTELQNKLNDHSRISKLSSMSLERKNIVSVETVKRQEIENIKKKMIQTEIALENNKKKLETAKARIRVLENDLGLAKTNLIIINEKKLHDEQLIQALNGQLRAVESRYRDKEIEIKNQRDKLQNNCVELKNELTAVKFQVEQLRKKIGERETEIDTLRSLHKSERIGESLSSCSCIHESSIDTTESSRIRDPNEYVISSLAAEAEQERLLKLVAVLNQRLDKERIDTDHASELLRCERNKNARLEKKLEQLEMERINQSRTNSRYHTKFSKSLSSVASSKDQLYLEERQYRLELLEEECLALKTRLITVQQEKETDLATYKRMLENTKKIFQNSSRDKITVARGHSAVTL